MGTSRHRQTPEDTIIGRHWQAQARIPSFLNPQYGGFPEPYALLVLQISLLGHKAQPCLSPPSFPSGLAPLSCTEQALEKSIRQEQQPSPVGRGSSAVPEATMGTMVYCGATFFIVSGLTHMAPSKNRPSQPSCGYYPSNPCPTA